MKFETKISGIRVDDFDIVPLFSHQIITLAECMEKVKRQETMDFLLDKFRFTLGKSGQWYAIIDHDTDIKLAILENHPDYEQKLTENIGTDWLNHYLRFGH